MGGFVYPYIFGRNDSSGTTSVTFYGGNKNVNKFNLASADDIYNLGFYTKLKAETAKVKGVIYSDNVGQPDALLGVTDELLGIEIGWNALSFASAVSLTAGNYWLGLLTYYHIYCNGTFTGSGVQKYNTNNYDDGPSDPFGTPTNSYYTLPVYAMDESFPAITVSGFNSSIVTHAPDISINSLVSNVVTHAPDISINSLIVNVVTNQRRNKQANMMVIT